MKKSAFLVLGILLTASVSYGQFFDFKAFMGGTGLEDPNEFPGGKAGTDNASLKTMYFDDTATWLGTYRSGIYEWHSKVSKTGTLQVFWQSPPDSSDIFDVYHIARLNTDYVYFTNEDAFTAEYKGFYRLKDSTNIPVRNIEVIERIGRDSTAPVLPPVNDLATMGDSLMLLATDSGLVITNGENIWRRRNKDNVSNITEWKIEAVASTSKGGIYLASGNEIYRQIGINWERINLGDAPYKLRNTSVKELRRGPNDTIWAITSKGIAKIHDTTGYSILNEEIKTLLNEVKDVAFDTIGNPWMIFELNGGIKFLDESTGLKTWRYINSTNSDLPDEVSCIAADKKGRIWIGTDESGMFRYLSFIPGNVAEQWPHDIYVFPTLGYGDVVIENQGKPIDALSIVALDGKPIDFDGAPEPRLELKLNPGMYIINITRNGKVFSQKIVML